MSAPTSVVLRAGRNGATTGETETLARLREVFRRAAGPEPRLVSLTLPVEGVDPVSLFAAAEASGDERAVWIQPDLGFAMVAVGSAWSVRASGARRFEEVAEAWSALTAEAAVHGPSVRGSGPLLVGGFGFAEEPARTGTWHGFEMAELVLPALLVTLTSEGAWLTSSQVLPPGDADDGVAQSLAARWEALSSAATGSAADAPGGAAGRPTLRLVASHPGPAEWRASVSRMAGAVGRGRLDKVVLARQVQLAAAASLDVPAILRRSRGSAPESTIFAIGRGRRTFLGASPERLVSVEGRHFRSMAMAGSIRRGGDGASDARLAAELLASDKEREEHAVVVEMLRTTLSPLAEALSIPSTPHVERLRHVQHLVTPVEGRLREPMDVLRLGGLLHPTPAVGGMPRDLALELIAEEEPLERGWYAGPLGWVDRVGDGELVVALRSGLVEDRSATLLAGCGIVADSDPEREWQESTTKLLALGSALGRVEM